MTWNSMRPSLRGRLARHLGRLQQSLDEVAEQVREAIATTVGRRMAEAVGEAVYEALCPGTGFAQPLPNSSYAGYESGHRRNWNESGWQRDAARSDWRDSYDYDDYDPRYDDDPELTAPRHNEPRSGRWGRAVAAGLQAATWWLRRHPGQVSLLAALAVGAVAGLAVLAGHASGVASVVMSALGLAYLLDLMRSASSLFGRDLRS